MLHSFKLMMVIICANNIFDVSTPYQKTKMFVFPKGIPVINFTCFGYNKMCHYLSGDVGSLHCIHCNNLWRHLTEKTENQIESIINTLRLVGFVFLSKIVLSIFLYFSVIIRNTNMLTDESTIVRKYAIVDHKMMVYVRNWYVLVSGLMTLTKVRTVIGVEQMMKMDVKYTSPLDVFFCWYLKSSVDRWPLDSIPLRCRLVRLHMIKIVDNKTTQKGKNMNMHLVNMLFSLTNVEFSPSLVSFGIAFIVPFSETSSTTKNKKRFGMEVIMTTMIETTDNDKASRLLQTLFTCIGEITAKSRSQEINAVITIFMLVKVGTKKRCKIRGLMHGNIVPSYRVIKL